MPGPTPCTAQTCTDYREDPYSDIPICMFYGESLEPLPQGGFSLSRCPCVTTTARNYVEPHPEVIQDLL